MKIFTFIFTLWCLGWFLCAVVTHNVFEMVIQFICFCIGFIITIAILRDSN